MSGENNTNLNGQIYKFASKRLKLKPRDRTIFYRLLGFLLRNDKPFPYSATAMANITGYDRATIFRSLNHLEHCRLIERKGMGKNRKFCRGSILIKIISIVANRSKSNCSIIEQQSQRATQKLNNSRTLRYKKTYSSLKHIPRERDIPSSFFVYQEYSGRLKTDIELGLISKSTKIMSYDDWLVNNIK